MIAKVTYAVNYDTNHSGTCDITVDIDDLPDDEDWLHLFYANVPSEITETAYCVEFIGCQHFYPNT